MTPTPAQLESVKSHLPDAREADGWNDARLLSEWAGSVARTVRAYWLDRVNATAKYIDLNNEGLPANQLHQNAKDMLEYWDSMIAAETQGTGPFSGRPTTFGTIKRRYRRVHR